jgi:hypothetical protein
MPEDHLKIKRQTVAAIHSFQFFACGRFFLIRFLEFKTLMQWILHACFEEQNNEISFPSTALVMFLE